MCITNLRTESVKHNLAELQNTIVHHKSHQMISKFFRIDIERLRKFFLRFVVYGQIFIGCGTSFMTTRMKVNFFGTKSGPKALYGLKRSEISE